MIYTFEWDPRKATGNLEKHGVRFEEAASVFLDPKMLNLFDTEHSEGEKRWVTIGISQKGRLLVVFHTFGEETLETAIIRIFSSRKGTQMETLQYQE